MPRPKPSTPIYQLHKSTGQAKVRINGKDHYLGLYGSPRSLNAYQRLLAELAANGGKMPSSGRLRTSGDGVSVAELCERYLAWADRYYRRADGTRTAQWDRCKSSLKPVAAIYGDISADEFDRKCLEAVRHTWVVAGRCRTQINLLTSCVKRTWKWAALEGITPDSVYQSLRLLPGLRVSHSADHERARVRPVPERDIEAVRPFLLPEVWEMVQLQLLTGMRPEEVRGISWDRIDQADGVWVYRPSTHKTQHLGVERVVLLGPKAQAVLARHVGAVGPIFSPRGAIEGLRLRKRAARASRVQPSQIDRRSENPARKPGEKWASTSYARAVRRACERAGITPWHPHQLRHNAATTVRSEFGPDVARAVLGHTSLQSTKIYAELDLKKAKKAMEKLG